MNIRKTHIIDTHIGINFSDPLNTKSRDWIEYENLFSVNSFLETIRNTLVNYSINQNVNDSVDQAIINWLVSKSVFKYNTRNYRIDNAEIGLCIPLQISVETMNDVGENQFNDAYEEFIFYCAESIIEDIKHTIIRTQQKQIKITALVENRFGNVVNSYAITI